jgi:putative membrane protein
VLAGIGKRKEAKWFSCVMDKLRRPRKIAPCFPHRSEAFCEALIFNETMQPGSNKLLRFLQSWIISTVAVLLAVIILRNHISYGDKVENLLIASFLLGILNTFVRPILMLIALPLLIFTLGLFTLVINALLLCFLSVLLPFFHVDSFGYALLGAIIISIISITLNFLTGNARVSLQRRKPPAPPKNSGGGPVIDV